MENLFDFLLTVMILLGVVSGLLNKLKKLFSPVDEKQVETSRSSNLYQDQGQPSKDTKQTSKIKQQKQEKPKKRSHKNLTRNSKSKQNKKQDKIKATEGKVISNNDFNRQQIVKGIIFKEILDEPRSKQPHSFFRDQK